MYFLLRFTYEKQYITIDKCHNFTVIMNYFFVILHY